jgi:two-component system, cell cycle sensor histidine kinase and response regulator CckA
MKRLLRVLIVEDSEDDAVMLLEELRRGGFEVEHVRVQTADTMRAALVEQTWDVIMSDYSMPTFTGIGALSVLKETGIDIPLIIASGTIGEETAVEALKAGASDFLVKDRLARLIPAIERETREAEGRRARRAAERALLQTKERMQFALESAGVGIWESDIASGRTSWSDILEQLHGLPVRGFPGTFDAFIECIHADDRQRVRNSISESLRNRLNSRVEYRTTWPDGSTHWIVGVGRTFYSEAGEPIRAAGVGIDITARKNLEEQFRQAQKLEAIGGLAAGVAHDFNNLLTIVAGYCELLAARLADDAGALQDLDEIRHASTSATALTRQLLAFGRRQIVAPRPVDLNSILNDSHKMLRRLVEENVQIDLRLADRLAPIHVDPGQIEQVLLNLVINARDAMLVGGVVTIETDNAVVDEPYARTHLDVQPGAYVLLSVSDTGSGMSPEVQSRLFEPFFTTKERGRGTGLGLATVYGIVKQSGGHIWVYSEAGMGTTFKIYWPVAPSTELPATAPARQAQPGGLHGSETVLVVEDEAPLRALTERMLQRYGYTVLLAANGEDAERICTEHQGPIHVVLMDVVMPGKSGRAVGDWIEQCRPETKIIYLSGYTDNAIAHHGVLDPGTTFLQKPFTSDVLIRTIREALS